MRDLKQMRSAYCESLHSQCDDFLRRILGVITVRAWILWIGLALFREIGVAPVLGAMDANLLFHHTNVWTVHLKFSADQWEKMEPKGGTNPFSFGGGNPDPGGGPGDFSLAMMLSPAFLDDGDADRDGRLSRDEFAQLAQKWFKAWDQKQTGHLGLEQIRSGLNAAGSPPDARRMAAPNGGMMLQGPEGKRNGLSSAMGIEFDYVHGDLEFEGQLLKDVGVRYKGNGTFMESRGTIKRSLKVNLNKYVKGQKIGDVAMLTLQNNVTDASWMNEVMAYRLYRDAGVPAPRTAYAKVFVTVPGKLDKKYLGLYSISEDVDKNFALQNFGTKTGAIFKPVTPSLFNYLGSDWAQYNQTYDPKTEIVYDEKKILIDLCRLVSEAKDVEFAERIGRYIDLPEFARFMAVMVYLSDLDGILGPGQNLFLHLHPQTQLLAFIPWDQDHSWGQFGRASQEQRDNMSILHPWQGENRFLERMFRLDGFRKLYTARMEEFSKTIFKPERFAEQMKEIAAAIRPAIKEESAAKLARFDKAVAGEILAGGGFGPFSGPGIKTIKPFTLARTASILDQIAGKSEGMTLGSFGFPGGGEPGPGGPQGFGSGMFFAESLFKALDENKDSTVGIEEFVQGFNRLFDAWSTDKSGLLTQKQLRAGIDKDLSPFHGGAPSFGAPPGQVLSPSR